MDIEPLDDFDEDAQEGIQERPDPPESVEPSRRSPPALRLTAALLYGVWFVFAIGSLLAVAAITFWTSVSGDSLRLTSLPVLGIAVVAAGIAARLAYLLRDSWRIHFLVFLAGPLISLGLWVFSGLHRDAAHRAMDHTRAVDAFFSQSYHTATLFGGVWMLAGVFGLLYVRFNPRVAPPQEEQREDSRPREKDPLSLD